MLDRLQGQWVYGGFLAGLLLLLLAPVLTLGLDLTASLTFLSLPVYMLHQYEEHDDDRFRRYLATRFGGEALSAGEVFVVNIVFVWLLLAAVLWLVVTAGPAWATVAGYLLLVNGVIHGLTALQARAANPGLWTGLVLFGPLGLALLISVGASAAAHLAALAFVVAVHLGIVLVARRRLAQGAMS